jgi:integrase
MWLESLALSPKSKAHVRGVLSRVWDYAMWRDDIPSQRNPMPWSYDQVWRIYQKAASAAGIGRLGTHSLRHTYRSLLDSVGTPLAVQQKLMRHTDIRTTMNVYGDVITDQESEALAKIARLAIANSTQTARGTA